MNTIFELRKAIYQHLIADTALMAMIDGVYDYVPQDANYPFIMMADLEYDDISTTAKNAFDVTADINIYTRDRGSKTLYEISDMVYNLLYNPALIVPNHNLINLQFTAGKALLDKDGITYKSSNQFTAIVQVA